MTNKKIIMIFELFRNINRAINKRIDCRLGCLRFNPTDIYIMIQLINGEKKTLKELSIGIGLANSTVSEAVDRLEKEGLVKRERDTVDKRRVFIYATEKAFSYKKEFEDKNLKILQDILKDISDEDLNCILNGLTKLNDIVKERSEL
ncbi:MarR family winged helix-turn-helix transcriptional regulator [Caloramator proteoclasticus]|uniref:DNA-binding transcriptional regulator, MarR family n=1 Tax=Caloramator proteoclasticus DSM 10124 TaxID=1121262 RepID=A0A1M4UL54_9CLOT|nr:MarR family transcriptional regulator [Caloramator proteoclasticus]SHE57439.1 DNA-binding transcriptional regulator, MarR family [Caloramator proteoclasticus DSM 10124]